MVIDDLEVIEIDEQQRRHSDELGSRPVIEVGHDLLLGAIRAEVEQAEEHTTSAWKLMRVALSATGATDEPTGIAAQR